MSEVFHRNIFLKGPAGRLEASLWTVSAAEANFVAVVCHPHPLYGGTLHNKVVYQTAKALHQRGAPVLRFNFRGAGQSEGVHDRGIGEQADVRTALNYLSTEFPGKRSEERRVGKECRSRWSAYAYKTKARNTSS